jgi:hypothetical protein
MHLPYLSSNDTSTPAPAVEYPGQEDASGTGTPSILDEPYQGTEEFVHSNQGKRYHMKRNLSFDSLIRAIKRAVDNFLFAMGFLLLVPVQAQNREGVLVAFPRRSMIQPKFSIVISGGSLTAFLIDAIRKLHG